LIQAEGKRNFNKPSEKHFVYEFEGCFAKILERHFFWDKYVFRKRGLGISTNAFVPNLSMAKFVGRM
jgi:hypothetical protein